MQYIFRMPAVDSPIVSPHSLDSSLEHWLALLHIEKIGSVRAQGLIERFGTPAGAFRASGAELSELDPVLPATVVRALLAGPDLSWARSQIHQADSLGAAILPMDHPDYPPGLRTIPCPPPVLFVQGSVPLTHPRSVAMVGTRQPTEIGLESARSLAISWASHGIRIVSGLARGIDEQSHVAALSAGGETTAVLGCPLDGLGTRGRGKIAQDIARHGVLVTEHPFDTPVVPSHFVRRNRIISGLSQAVVVVEAPTGSGALITARNALEQNRELLACPGPVGAPTWNGCFDLLRDGARICARPEDLLETLGWDRLHGPGDPTDSSPLVRLLLRGDATAEEMSLQLNMPLPVLQGEIVLLELSGRVRRLGGARYTVRP